MQPCVIFEWLGQSCFQISVKSTCCKTGAANSSHGYFQRLSNVFIVSCILFFYCIYSPNDSLRKDVNISHDKNVWFLINYIISNIYNLILMIQGTTQIRTAVLVPQVSRIEKSLEKSELHIRIIGGHFPNSHFSLSSHQSTGRIHLTSPQITIGSFINQFINLQPVRLQQLSFDVPFR